MDIGLVPLFEKLAPHLLAGLGKTVASPFLTQWQINTAIQDAVSDTTLPAEASDWLADWRKSDSFKELLVALISGQRRSEQDILDDFLKFVPVIDCHRARDQALNLLRTFLTHLDQTVVFRSRELATHDQREESRHREALAHWALILEAIRTPGTAGLVPGASRDDAGGTEALYHAKLDEAKRLLDRGKVKAAQSVAQAVREELGDQPHTNNLRFRIETNLGVCALALGDIQGARQHLSAAAASDATKALAWANLAQLALREGNTEQGLADSGKALDLDCSDVAVVATRLLVLHETGREQQFSQLSAENDAARNSTKCLAVVALQQYEQRRFAESEEILKSCLRNSNQGGLWELLGRTIFVPTQEKLRASRALPWRMEETDRSRLKEAESAFTKAIELLRTTDYERELQAALVNRAGCRISLGNLAGALEDSSEAHQLDPTCIEAAHARVTAHILREEFSQALKILDAEPNLKNEPRMLIHAAYAYRNQEQFSDVVQVLEPHWRATTTPDTFELIATLLAQAHRELGNIEKSRQLVTQVLEKTGRSPQALLIGASHELAIGENDRADELVSEALDSAGPDPAPAASDELGDILARLGRFSEAATAYERIFSGTPDDPVREKYVLCLYRSSRRSRAYKVARQIRLREGVVPAISEVEARLAAEIGELPDAAHIFTQLCSIKPVAATLRVVLVQLLYKMLDWEACKKDLQRISIDDDGLSPEDLLTVSRYRKLLDLPTPLEFAYEAWRRGRNIPEVQLGYAAFFFSEESRGNSALEPAETARADTTVTLARGKETREVTLVAESDAAPMQGEVSVKSKQGHRLLGVKKGDTVYWSETSLGSIGYQVADVQSKYVSAVRKVFQEFPFAFPDDQSLIPVEVPPGDPSLLLASIERRHQHAESVLDLYRSRKATIAMLGKLLGMPLGEAWMRLSMMDNEKLLVSTGSQEEADEAGKALKETKGLVMDFTALLTAARLNILDKVSETYADIIVPQHVVDEVLNTLAEWKLEPQGMYYWGKQNGYYVEHKGPPEYRKELSKLLETIVDFIKSKATIKGCPALLEYEPDTLGRLSEALGKPILASGTLAEQLSLPLWVDDLASRLATRNERQIDCVSTQCVLSDLLSRQAIAAPVYSSYVNQLLGWNYWFIRVRSEDLIVFLEEQNFAMTNGFLKRLQNLAGPECTLDSAIDVAAGMVMTAHQRNWPLSIIDLLLDALIGVVVRGRDPRTSLSRLEQRFRAGLQTSSLIKDRILVSIVLWRKLMSA